MGDDNLAVEQGLPDQAPNEPKRRGGVFERARSVGVDLIADVICAGAAPHPPTRRANNENDPRMVQKASEKTL